MIARNEVPVFMLSDTPDPKPLIELAIDRTRVVNVVARRDIAVTVTVENPRLRMTRSRALGRTIPSTERVQVRMSNSSRTVVPAFQAVWIAW